MPEAVLIHEDYVLNREAFSGTSKEIEQAIEDGVFPGGVLLFAKDRQLVVKKAAGNLAWESSLIPTPPEVTSRTVYDIGGLTSLFTSLLIMKLVDEGMLRLEDRVSRYLQSFGVFGKSPIRVRDLLVHRSGLPASVPFYEELQRAHAGARLGILTTAGAKDFVFNMISRIQIKNEPGARQVTSELGPIILGEIAALVCGCRFDQVLQKYLIDPIGLKNTAFIDLELMKQHDLSPQYEVVAPTEECVWRKKLLWGEVQDDNAWAIGGIAGHSGIFSTADDLFRLSATLLECWRGENDYLSQSMMRLAWTRGSKESDQSWCMGWDTPSKENGMIDSGLSSTAVGAVSFSGCSWWIEPSQGLSLILLTNRVHPNRTNRKIGTFRPALYAKLMKAYAGLSGS